MESDGLRVDIWKGDWGLPSIDMDCLYMLTCLRIAGVEVEIRVTNNPFRSPSGKLPVIYHNDNVVTDIEGLFGLLQKMGRNPDESLDAEQRSKIVAYSHLISHRLLPGLLYSWWVDEDNQNKFSLVWYRKALPFPLNFFYPRKICRQAVSVLEAHHQKGVREAESVIYKEFENCLSMLTSTLGKNHYFFGRTPCSFDALLYAYLAPTMLAPLPSREIQTILTQYPSLRKYVTRISETYFSSYVKAYNLKICEESRKNLEAYSDEYPHAMRNKILAGLFAATAMAFYAVSTGLIKIRSR